MGLKDLTDRSVGVALRWQDIERYPKLVLENFNSLTPEYEGSFSFINKSSVLNWEPCDKIYEFCKTHNLAFRMTPTTQINPKFIPNWMDNHVDRLKGFIEEIVWRYEDCIGFNLVNEFISDNGLIVEQSFWYQTLGPMYYETLLTWGKTTNPNAKLFIEDHRIQYPRRWIKLFDVAKQLDGLITGVGIHGHHDLPSPLQLPSFKTWIKKFKKLGVEVNLSEISLSKGRFTFIDDLIFEEFYRGFIKKMPTDCPITFWGMLDNRNNKRRFSLFDNDGTPNTSYRGIEKGLDVNSKPLFSLETVKLFNAF